MSLDSTSPEDPRLRLLRAETTPEETRVLVAAALAVDESPDAWVPPETDPAAFDDALERLAARASGWEETAAADRRDAEARVARLLEQSTDHLAVVEDDPALHTWAAAEVLREASLELGTDDPERAVVVGQLAERAARGVAAAGAVPAQEADDLLALALAQRANAARVASDLRAADALLHRAVTVFRTGTGDPLVQARLWSLASSLRSDQTRFDEALTLTRRAATLYRRLGDPECEGRSRLKEATLLAYLDDPESALDVLDEAWRLLGAAAGSESAVEPRLRFAVHQNRASYLERLDRPEEAGQAHARAGEALDDLAPSDPQLSLDRLRWAWLRGRLEVQAGSFDAAEETFGRVRKGFETRGLGYEAAQVSLELAVLFARRGRTAAMKRLAEEVTPLFAARDLHGEARTALEIYRQAVHKEAVETELLEGLVARLRRARP